MPRRWFNDGAWRHIFGDRRHVVDSGGSVPAESDIVSYSASLDSTVRSQNNSGVERWSFALASGAFAVECDSDGNVYAGGDFGVRAWDAAQAELWHYTPFGSRVFSLALDGAGWLYACGGSTIRKLDAATGAEETTGWPYTAATDLRTLGCTADGAALYAGDHDRTLYRLLADGTVDWSAATAQRVWALTAHEDGGVIFGGNDGLHRWDSTGALVWDHDNGDWVEGLAASRNGYVWAGGRNTKVLTKHAVADGALLWTVDWGAAYGTDSLRGVEADPYDNVLCGDTGGRVVKYDPDGNELWVVTPHTDFAYETAVSPGTYPVFA